MTGQPTAQNSVTSQAFAEKTPIVRPAFNLADSLVDSSRDGLWLARNATSFSIKTAKFWTKFGLEIGRRATQFGVGIPAMIADASNGDPGFTRGQGLVTTTAMTSINALFDAISLITLGSIDVGGRVADASLGIASSSFGFFQSELAQCLASVARLLHRNWTHQDERLPPGGIPPYSALEVMQALTAWISIQQVTHQYAEKRLLSGVIRLEPSELRSQVASECARQRARSPEGNAPLAAIQDPRIIEESKMPEDGGDIVSAEIGHANQNLRPEEVEDHDFVTPLTPAQAVVAFARYSRLALAVYGGAALRIWGVEVPYGLPADKSLLDSLEDQFAAPVHDANAQAHSHSRTNAGHEAPGCVTTIFDSESAAAAVEADAPPTLIDLFSGRHDDDIFHRYTGLEQGSVTSGEYPESAPNAPEPEIPFKPKYYVVTDHDAKKVILVLRGTLSLGDAAADLTCDSIPFQNMDAFNPAPRRSAKIVPDRPAARGEHHDDNEAMLVHEGMYLTALAIGGRTEAPVHQAIAKALRAHPGYDLDLVGHSLGGGVSALLALLWVGIPIDSSSDVLSARTSHKSGLPAGRRVHAYCFAPPAVMSAPLGRRCATFINGWTNAYDAVPRLSLGSILDIRNACAWLLYEQSQARLGSTTTTGREYDAREVDHAADAVMDEIQGALVRQGDAPIPTGEPSQNQRARSAPFELSTLIKQAALHVAWTPGTNASQTSFDPSNLFNRFVRPSFASEDQESASRAHTEEVFWSLRKSLESRMKHVELYPPGDILLTMGGDELYWLDDMDKVGKGARDSVYGQIEFRKGFLQSHFAHVHHAILAAFLNKTTS